MPNPRGDRPSIWQGLAAHSPTYAPLTPSRDLDVLVVGAGITGLTTALLLAEAGRDVTVVEALQIGHGTTGGTTGKVTSQHGLIYQELVDQHGEDVARTYAKTNEGAITLVREIVARHGIEAGLSERDAYVFSERQDQAGRVRREAEIAARLGLPATWTEETELPFDVVGAVRFTGQAQVQAVDYLHGLAAAVDAHAHGAVHEGTRVTAVEEDGDDVVVETSTGTVRAREVVLATLIPILDRGFEFARMEPKRTYGIAVRAPGDVAPEGMYLSAEEPTRSTRRHDSPEGTFLVVVGDAHRTGADRDTMRHDAALAAFARERFGLDDIAYRWSAQDFVPADILPFIGPTPFADHISVATGFQKWGLSWGTAAARILCDQLLGRPHPAAEVVTPRRTNLAASAKLLVEHNVDSAARFVGDRMSPDAASIDDIPPGSGGIVRDGASFLAVARHPDGSVTTRSAVCRHLGCLVQWNAGERSWDCPCHGSRYDTDGTVLEGPAVQPLSPAEE